jgi:hypothetical protein
MARNEAWQVKEAAAEELAKVIIAAGAEVAALALETVFNEYEAGEDPPEWGPEEFTNAMSKEGRGRLLAEMPFSELADAVVFCDEFDGWIADQLADEIDNQSPIWAKDETLSTMVEAAYYAPRPRRNAEVLALVEWFIAK